MPHYKIKSTLPSETVRTLKLTMLKSVMDDKLIQTLIIDPYFGIYTRNGLEYILSQNDVDINIYLVDFNDVRGMNKSLGYRKVNDIFKTTFEKLKEDFIIGRAFSGDEIFFCTENNINIEKVISVCESHGLGMIYVKGTYQSKDDIRIVLDNLLDKLHDESKIK